LKSLGYKTVALTSIRLDPAELRRRSKEQRVIDLAETIERYGGSPLHAPTVRFPGRVLLCGRDRMAALVRLGAKRVEVHAVECTDEEAQELELIENLHKRPEDKQALIAQLARLREAFHRAQDPDAAEQTIAARVNDDVAKSTGDSVRNVQRAKSQARHAVAVTPCVTQHNHVFGESGVCEIDGCSKLSDAELLRRGAPQTREPLPPPNLDLLGVDDDSTRAVCKFVQAEQAAIDEADKHLRLALAALKPIELSRLGQELRAQVSRVGELVRSQRPAALCPWCKGLPKATVGLCGGCRGEMWVSAEVAGRAPRELRDETAPVVAYNGKFIPYAAARAGKLPRNGTAPGKTISVVDEAGANLLGEAMAAEERELAVEYDEEEQP